MGVDREVAAERVHDLIEREVEDLAAAALRVTALEQREPVLGDCDALDVEPLAGAVLPEELVQVPDVHDAGKAAQPAVLLERPHEATVAAVAAARAERQQRAVRVEAKRRDHGHRLEVGLRLGALALRHRELAPEERHELAGAAVGEREDREVQLVVADHVDPVAAADQAGARRHVVGAPLGGVRQRQLAQLSELDHGRGATLAERIGGAFERH
jgi:hypothetical protein